MNATASVRGQIIPHPGSLFPQISNLFVQIATRSATRSSPPPPPFSHLSFLSHRRRAVVINTPRGYAARLISSQVAARIRSRFTCHSPSANASPNAAASLAITPMRFISLEAARPAALCRIALPKTPPRRKLTIPLPESALNQLRDSFAFWRARSRSGFQAARDQHPPRSPHAQVPRHRGR